MTCRHQPGDPNCSSHPSNVASRAYEDAEYNRKKTQAEYEKQINELRAQIPASPDSKNYSVEEVEQVGDHVVLKVKYPNCAKCTYEGNKVMVFLNVTLKDVVKWRRIDPHFRAPTQKLASEAPSPSARFPGNNDGWKDALAYATAKVTYVR